MDRLKERGEDKRVTKSYQMTGLNISQILNDPDHKALYIKLAKEYNGQKLMELAKDVADRENVNKPGAYFMKLFQKKKDELK